MVKHSLKLMGYHDIIFMIYSLDIPPWKIVMNQHLAVVRSGKDW